jgi:hypothetical protein
MRSAAIIAGLLLMFAPDSYASMPDCDFQKVRFEKDTTCEREKTVCSTA